MLLTFTLFLCPLVCCFCGLAFLEIKREKLTIDKNYNLEKHDLGKNLIAMQCIFVVVVTKKTIRIKVILLL